MCSRCTSAVSMSVDGLAAYRPTWMVGMGVSSFDLLLVSREIHTLVY